MKRKSINKFRIGAMCLIALFLLMPLLSSPVAAANTFNLGEVWTNNTSSGPTVGYNSNGGISPGTYTYSRGGGAATVTFICDYDFSDTSGNLQTPSSSHYAELNVQRVSPSIGPFYMVNTGTINLNDGQSTSGTLQITDTYNSAWSSVTWQVSAYVYCEDLPTETAAWNTWYWTFTI